VNEAAGRVAWVLTAVACLLAALVAGLAYCMVIPVRWDGPGIFGAVALFFPLHLLALTLLAAVLAILAKLSGARLATWVSGLVVILSAAMALTPTVAVWQQARELDVPLSLADYLDNAWRLNMGVPQQDRTVVYGMAKNGANLELDVWRTGQSDTGPLRPAVVFVHGGAWIHGNRSGLPDWNRWLNERGYEVFDVEYRMPPRGRWQDEAGDVKAALGWLAAHAAEYHVDPSRIVTMGYSAGGNLAMLAAYSTGAPQLPPSTEVPEVSVRCVINLYGPADLALGFRSSDSLEYAQAAMKRYLGGTPGEFPERYRALSPLTHVNAKTPPTFTILGTRDRIVRREQAELLDQALTRAGVVHENILLPGNDHGFDVNWGGFGTQIARARIKDFLGRC